MCFYSNFAVYHTTTVLQHVLRDIETGLESPVSSENFKPDSFPIRPLYVKTPRAPGSAKADSPSSFVMLL